MARQEKSTRARGLPPRVLLSQRQDATGSFPTVWRTSSDNRTGRYNVSFNDNKVVPFNQYEAADYDSFLPLGNAVYIEKVENVGAVETGGTKTVTYPTAFVGSPIVVISELSSANGDSSQNVNVFLIGREINNFKVKFSSQFTGSLVYRAVYDPTPGTLRVVERAPRYTASYTRLVAKTASLTDTNTADITFNDFGDDTAENFVTFFDKLGQSNIWPNITAQTRTSVALTASAIATTVAQFERFHHGLHNRGIIYPLGMNQATILAGLSQENQIEMYGSVSFMSGALVNQPTKWIVASGSMKKNVADTFITFTPGQDIQAFRDNNNPAVDGKISSSVNGINPFYATGSAVTVTGQGFQQPLWSKSKIEIDLTPSATQTFTASLGYAAAGSYPMGYWNPNTKLYEGIGTGKGTGNYANTLDGLKQHLEEQTLGFALSMDNGNTLTGFAAGTFNLYGRQISNYGFPYHPKFQPTGSQQLNMSDYISEPFLLEKIVLETSGTLGMTQETSKTSIWTFFLLNSRSQISGSTSNLQSVYYKNTNDNSAPLSFVTSSILTNTSCDLIDHLQICISVSLDTSGYLRREALVDAFNFGELSRQFILSSSVKASLSYEEGFAAPYSESAVGPGGEYIQNLNYSGRNQLNRANGRDWRSTFEIPSITGTGTYGIGGDFINSVNVNSNYTKPNPYLLLPTDKLTFGFQLPTGRDMGAGAGEQSTITFSPQGINKISLYGSSLRVNPETNQLEEHHDTLNQLLSSESIHEVITG